jgi:hypothetical protein
MDCAATLEIGRCIRALPSRMSAIHICITGGKRSSSFLHGSVMIALARFVVETK